MSFTVGPVAFSSLLQAPIPAADAERWLRLAARMSVAFLAVYVLGRWAVVPVAERAVAARNLNNRTLADAIGRYLRLTALLLAVVAAIAAAGYTDVLARSGIVIAAVTIALGIAGQEVIGNLVSGAFLVSDTKFNVGDYIVWDEREGVVQQLGFRVTRVRTPDNEVVTVPNTELTTTAVVSPFDQRRFRVSETLVVGYDTDLEDVRRLIRRAAREVPAALETPAPSVQFVGFGDDGIRLRAGFWMAEPQRSKVIAARWEFARRARRLLADADVDVAPPAEHALSGRLSIASEPSEDRNVESGDDRNDAF